MPSNLKARPGLADLIPWQDINLHSQGNSNGHEEVGSYLKKTQGFQYLKKICLIFLNLYCQIFFLSFVNECPGNTGTTN